MARRKTDPLRCTLCGRFIGYNGEIHYYQPNAGPYDMEPPKTELEHQSCYEKQQRTLIVAAAAE